MKIQIFLIAALMTFFPGQNALAQDDPDHQKPEQINNFIVDLEIQKNGTLNVTESISFDFGSSPNSHGIFRNIPYAYTDDFGKHNLNITLNDDVVDEFGNAYENSISQDDKFFNLKIGSPDVIVSGVKTYVISYSVKNAISFTDFEYDKIIWTAIGSEWQVPIKNNQISLKMADDDYEIFAQAECLTDYEIAVIGEDCDISYTKDKIIFQTSRPLKFQEGITINASWPKGIVAGPETNTAPIVASPSILTRLLGVRAMAITLLIFKLL